MNARRGGFTLVEMLVVITIIGVLATLVLVSGGVVIRKTREATMVSEVSQLELSLEKFINTKGGATPPSGSVGAGAAVSQNLLMFRNFAARAFPSAETFSNPQTAAGFRQYHFPKRNGSTSTVGLDPAEALVFWLGGYSNLTPDGTGVLINNGKKLLGFRSNAKQPFVVDVSQLQTPGGWTAAGDFPFDETRLVNFDGDGFYEYKPRYSDQPYVFFSSLQYAAVTYDGTPFYFAPDGSSVAHPYRVDEGKGIFKGTATDLVQAVEPDGFQIICAGLDGEYGNPVEAGFRGYPFGTNLSKGDMDNITNFSEGRIDANLQE